MNCLEFQRIALSDPNNREDSFLAHRTGCADCQKYLSSVRKMDADLDASLRVEMPPEFAARLQLQQVMQDHSESRFSIRRYAMVASFALLLFVAGFIASGQFGVGNSIDEDYQTLLAGVIEHVHQQPMTPMLDRQRANRNAKSLLASYDPRMQIKPLDNLQFSKICTMGIYRGLHASLETPDGSVIFAYIKGTPVSDVLDAGYEGYTSRVKPLPGGNLIIMSRTQKSLEQAHAQLEDALYWQI